MREENSHKASNFELFSVMLEKISGLGAGQTLTEGWLGGHWLYHLFPHL